MQESLLKPLGDKTPDDITEQTKKGLLRLFELEPSQIANLFSELKDNKESFTAAKIADLLNIRTPKAARLYETFLETIHMYSTHSISLDSIVDDLKSIGREQKRLAFS